MVQSVTPTKPEREVLQERYVEMWGQKAQQASELKRQMNLLAKKQTKQQKKELKALQVRAHDIAMMKDRIKINTEKMAIQNWIKAQQLKDEAIKKEIKLINKKDSEARRLEHAENEII